MSAQPLISFILVEKTPFHHACIEAANKERDFLKAQTGKRYRVMKVLNVAGTQVPKIERALEAVTQRPCYRNGER